MSDLVVFLTARLDEDEDFARTMAAVGKDAAKKTMPPGREDALKALLFEIVIDPRARKVIGRFEESGGLPPNDLDRILREVDAKRRILAAYLRVLDECATLLRDRRPRAYGQFDGLDEAVKLLAAVYSDHPDYDPAWA